MSDNAVIKIVSISFVGIFIIVTPLFIITLLITNKSLDIEIGVHNLAYQFVPIQND
jgi:hypothetical protein